MISDCIHRPAVRTDPQPGDIVTLHDLPMLHYVVLGRIGDDVSLRRMKVPGDTAFTVKLFKIDTVTGS